jgi:hypothetical protein
MVIRIIVVTEKQTAIIDLAEGGRMLAGATMNQAEAADILRPFLESYLATHPAFVSGNTGAGGTVAT